MYDYSREIDAVAPAKVVTIGSSMGGYAAVRAGVALNADAALAFSPQVLLDVEDRKKRGLPEMMFDDVLKWTKLVAQFENFELRPLTDVVRDAPAECTTQIEVHVGGVDEGDVTEVNILKAAVDRRARKGRRGGLSMSLTVHGERDHNLVVDMRNSGELHALLRRHVGGEEPEGEEAAPPATRGVGGRGIVNETDAKGAAACTALRSQGQSAFQQSNYEDAIALFQRAVAADPSNASAACDLSAAGLAADEASVALEAAEAALRIRSDWPLAWARRVRALRAAGRFSDAVMCCNALESANLVGAGLKKESESSKAQLKQLQQQLQARGRTVAP